MMFLPSAAVIASSEIHRHLGFFHSSLKEPSEANHCLVKLPVQESAGDTLVQTLIGRACKRKSPREMKLKTKVVHEPSQITS